MSEAVTLAKPVHDQVGPRAGYTFRTKCPRPVAAACSNLVESLRARVEAHPDRVLYEYIDHSGEVIVRLTFGDLDTRARAIAGYLQELGTSGERALLLYPHGADFIAAFFGCLYAGSVAIPAYPPRRHRGGERLAAIRADSRAGVVLTSSSLLPILQEPSIAGTRPLPTLATDLLEPSMAEGFQARNFEPHDVAMLQYTSGSTALPKGVCVTHGNLYHNEDTIRRAFDQSADSVVVSWLPLYHDMGLIGGMLQPLFVGARCVILSPMSFLQRPVLWLETLSRCRGTTSGGPDFAYDLCVDKVSEDELAQLDLSSWRLAFNVDHLPGLLRPQDPAGHRCAGRGDFVPVTAAEAWLLACPMRLAARHQGVLARQAPLDEPGGTRTRGVAPRRRGRGVADRRLRWR